MARTVTLGKLRGLARLYADQRPADETKAFVNAVGTTTTAGLNDLINLAIGEFFDKQALSGVAYIRSSAAVTLVAGTRLYNLPATFYLPLHLELNWSSSDVEPVMAIANPSDRYKYLNLNIWGSWTAKAIQVVGSQFEILPTPTSVPPSGATLYFIPTFTDLVNDSDTLEGVNGWEKLVALKVAMELRAIEQQPYADLERLYEREQERIDAMLALRQPGPPQVQDVLPELGPGLAWPYTGGPVTT